MTRTKNRSCTGKRRFESKAEARASIGVLIREHLARPGVMQAYRRKHCDGGWHIGHRVRRRHQK